ncbi:MAG TPA: alpha/beta hydrolase [Longimicrobiales bacterium]|nr:alpha/beta hydrolase [Longimicrobiales bacterium]
MTELRHRREVVGDVRLHWVEEGEGAPVVLLHGFPDFWYGWRYQIPALAAAGYRAVAPDLRGYAASDKPEGIESYRLDLLGGDVVGLLDTLGAERAHLVGHDWGGALAWWVAAHHPDRVSRLTVVNAPHPLAMRRALRGPAQLLRSWYVLLFQVPGLPERLFRAFDYELVERIMRRDIRRRDVLHETDFLRYADALSRPDALRSMLHWYRAAFREGLRGLMPWARRRIPVRAGAWRVEAPTLVVWGERDPWLGPGLLRDLERWVPDLLVERIAHGGHWVHVEAWERVNRTLLWFLGQREASEPPPPPT